MGGYLVESPVRPSDFMEPPLLVWKLYIEDNFGQSQADFFNLLTFLMLS